MHPSNGTHHCQLHPQVKLVFSGHNRRLNTSRYLCPLCGTLREYSSGVIRHTNTSRGFFFIENVCGRDVFAHVNDLAVSFEPRPGLAVAFEVESAPRGLKAAAIRPL